MSLSYFNGYNPQTPPFTTPLPTRPIYAATKNLPLKSQNLTFYPQNINFHSSIQFDYYLIARPLTSKSYLRFMKFVPFASQDEKGTTQIDQTVQEPEIQDSSAGAVGVENSAGVVEESGGEDVADEVETTSIMVTSLRSYREALESNDEARIVEIEDFLKSFEDDRNDIARKVASLNEELAAEKYRVLSISAEFVNFRKRVEREKQNLVKNAQGKVVESLLSVLSNFERTKSQIKFETEGEEKIHNSYQSIYKQFVEILGSLGVVPIEKIGNPFDPLARYRGASNISLLDGISRKFDEICSAFLKRIRL